MNRPGQPQQRPPSITPNPPLASQFRPPYPNYGMPPRGVLQGGFVPGLRAPTQQPPPQSMVSQPSPAFIQQRGQNAFPFGGTLGQSQQHQSPLQQHQQQQQQPSQQQQTNGTANQLPPHLTQTTTPTPGTAPSASSASEVGLDPNDFPALGSTSTTNGGNLGGGNNGGVGATTSYASQAGTGVPLGGAGAGTTGGASTGTGLGGNSGIVGNANQPRDFTPDDFPALGGQSHNPPTSHTPSHDTNHSHPPGLNGFQQHTDHRQTLIGSIHQTTPGMLNLGSRSVHPGFQQGQTEAEKQQQQQRNNYALKLNQATHAAWNSPTLSSAAAATSQAQQNAGGLSLSLGLGGASGAFANPPPPPQPATTTTQQNGAQIHANQNSTTTHPNAPPGVPPLAGSYAPPPPPPGAIANAAAPAATNGLAQGESNPSTNPNPNNPNPNPPTNNANNASSVPNSTTQAHMQHPQTPAQQVLMSAADRWGLLGLLAMIKNAGTDLDQGLSSVGTDLGTMGLDMGYTGNLYSTFITPWSDQSAAHSVEPDFHLPACYSVQPPPPGPNKATAFSDETLFFMFYSSPRDALQEVAAQELWNRNWRFHKDLRLWITKESGTSPSQKVVGGEQGQYTFWDPEAWVKERKEMTVLYADLEEKSVPAFVNGPGLVPTQTQPGLPQTQQQQLQQSQVQQGQAQRGPFQMGM